MTPRPALLAFAVLAALVGCATPEASPEARPVAPPTPVAPGGSAEAPVAPDRAAAAGLSPAQAAVLSDLGVPVAVPGALPAGWRVASVDAEAGDFARYAVHYGGPGGACFVVVGETEGLGIAS